MLGMFDPPSSVAYNAFSMSSVASRKFVPRAFNRARAYRHTHTHTHARVLAADHIALAEFAARQGITLLRNTPVKGGRPRRKHFPTVVSTSSLIASRACTANQLEKYQKLGPDRTQCECHPRAARILRVRLDCCHLRVEVACLIPVVSLSLSDASCCTTGGIPSILDEMSARASVSPLSITLPCSCTLMFLTAGWWDFPRLRARVCKRELFNN